MNHFLRAVSRGRGRRFFFRLSLALLVCGLLSGIITLWPAQAGGEPAVQDVVRLSVGSNGEQGDNSSFYQHLSFDGRYTVFESYAGNWAPDQPPNDNAVDIFVRDRLAGQTTKLSFGYAGQMTDDDSIDPSITADGRYVAFNSYATNIVPNDTNRDLWFRDGLDLFVHDRQTGQTVRASLTAYGQQIDGNSFGVITPDGQFVVFFSDAQEIIPGEGNGERRTALYLRNWRTGETTRITQGIDGRYPDGLFQHVWASQDSRYIAYSSESTNLVPGDTNGHMDVFLFDRLTGQTTRISRPAGGGQGNGLSGQPQITHDGRFIVFRSFADNLVLGDGNGHSDIFVYNMATGAIRRVSIGTDGTEGNGHSRDPSICNDGRYVTFNTDADNFFTGDNNGERDIYLYNLVENTLKPITRNEQGEWGNGRAHRSFLAPDCRYLAFASEADNVIAGDTNQERDIFGAVVYRAPDLSDSVLLAPNIAAPGEIVTYRVTIDNDGTVPAAASFAAPLPALTTPHLPGLSGGITYNDALAQFEWNGTVAGESSRELTFAVQIDPAVVEPTAIILSATLTGDGNSYQWLEGTVINGLPVHLPVSARP